MSTPPYTLQTVRQIWNDRDGDRVDVAPDADGTDCVELLYRNEKGEVNNSRRLTMPPAQARLVAQAMVALADELEAAS